MVSLQESGKKNNKKKISRWGSFTWQVMNGWIHFMEVFRLYKDKTP